MNTAPWSVAAAGLLFASAGVAARLAPDDVSAADLGLVRLLAGGALLAAVIGPRAFVRALRAAPAAALACSAVAMAVFQWSFFAAVGQAGVAVASLAGAGASPLMADLMARASGRGAPALALPAALNAMSYALLAASGVPIQALALSALSAAAYAGYASAASHMERAYAGGGVAATALALLAGGLILLPAGDAGLLSMLAPRGILLAAYLGACATALAYAWLVRGLRGVSAAGALGILLMQPVAAVAAAATLLHEPLPDAALAAAAGFALAFAARRIPSQPVAKETPPCR